MRIGLIAVDGHGGFPNLALMRISAWHKRRGDHVEWWNGFTPYDRVYLSKIFTFTPDFDMQKQHHASARCCFLFIKLTVLNCGMPVYL